MSTISRDSISSKSRADFEQEPGLDARDFISAIDRLGAVMMLLDREMRIVWYNARLAQTVDNDDLKGRICSEVLRPPGFDCGECAVRRTFATGLPQSELRPGPLPDGTGLERYITTLPVFDNGGTVVR